MARERDSTGYSTDVPDAGKMAASPPKVQTTASTMKTAKRVKGKQGQMDHRDCSSSKEGAAESVASGK